MGGDTDQSPFTITYRATVATDLVVKATPGFLHSIIIGKDVSGGIVEVSDDAADGDGDIKVYLEDPDVGTYLVDAMFTTGICADITTQTNVSFVWR